MAHLCQHLRNSISTALISSREVLLLPLAQIVQKVENNIYGRL